MLDVDAFVSLVTLGLYIFCLVEVITTPEGEMRNLPKLTWLFLVLLVPLIGSIVWLVAGRPESRNRARSKWEAREVKHFPEYDRPGRMAGTNPDSDDAFLAQVKARAEAQRKAYETKRREATDTDPSAPEAPN